MVVIREVAGNQQGNENCMHSLNQEKVKPSPQNEVVANNGKSATNHHQLKLVEGRAPQPSLAVDGTPQEGPTLSIGALNRGQEFALPAYRPLTPDTASVESAPERVPGAELPEAANQSALENLREGNFVWAIGQTVGIDDATLAQVDEILSGDIVYERIEDLAESLGIPQPDQVLDQLSESLGVPRDKIEMVLERLDPSKMGPAGFGREDLGEMAYAFLDDLAITGQVLIGTHPLQGGVRHLDGSEASAWDQRLAVVFTAVTILTLGVGGAAAQGVKAGVKRSIGKVRRLLTKADDVAKWGDDAFKAVKQGLDDVGNFFKNTFNKIKPKSGTPISKPSYSNVKPVVEWYGKSGSQGVYKVIERGKKYYREVVQDPNALSRFEKFESQFKQLGQKIDEAYDGIKHMVDKNGRAIPKTAQDKAKLKNYEDLVDEGRKLESRLEEFVDNQRMRERIEMPEYRGDFAMPPF